MKYQNNYVSHFNTNHIILDYKNVIIMYNVIYGQENKSKPLFLSIRSLESQQQGKVI